MNKQKRNQRICDLYRQYQSMIKVEQITGYNYRTIRRALVKNGIDPSVAPKRKRTAVLLINTKNNTKRKFNSILEASKFLHSLDKFIYVKAIEYQNLALLETFKIKSVSSYRRYITKCLSGELDKINDWKVEEIK